MYQKIAPLSNRPPSGAVDNSPNLPHRGRGTAAAVEEGRYGRERCVKREAPLQGELSAQLTEGFRLGI